MIRARENRYRCRGSSHGYHADPNILLSKPLASGILIANKPSAFKIRWISRSVSAGFCVWFRTSRIVAASKKWLGNDASSTVPLKTFNPLAFRANSLAAGAGSTPKALRQFVSSILGNYHRRTQHLIIYRLLVSVLIFYSWSRAKVSYKVLRLHVATHDSWRLRAIKWVKWTEAPISRKVYMPRAFRVGTMITQQDKESAHTTYHKA